MLAALAVPMTPPGGLEPTASATGPTLAPEARTRRPAAGPGSDEAVAQWIGGHPLWVVAAGVAATLIAVGGLVAWPC
ncbi:MAG: hypothetical protein R3F59_22825 [Myxococcota bacterium]